MMAAIKERWGDALRYHYEALEPDVPLMDQPTARDFAIKGHPWIGILSPRGDLVRSWYGVVEERELETALKEATGAR